MSVGVFSLLEWYWRLGKFRARLNQKYWMIGVDRIETFTSCQSQTWNLFSLPIKQLYQNQVHHSIIHIPTKIRHKMKEMRNLNIKA
jgi:hypothetical protein